MARKMHKIVIINGQKFYFRKRGKVWYYRSFNEDGKEISRSTGQTSIGAAEKWLTEQVGKGNIVLSKEITFGKYAANWWIMGKCDYIKKKQLRGARISEGYADTQRSYLENHILPYFKDVKLSKIKPVMIEKWIFELKDNGLSPTTINHCLRVLKIMLNEAYEMGYIAYDPSKRVKQLAKRPKEKGILTIDEVKALFDENKIKEIWDGDLKHYTLNLLASVTGMRMGEIQGLQIKDIHPNYLIVNGAWRRKYGLADEAKWGSNREIPIPQKVHRYLNILIETSPYKQPDDFVFYGTARDKPVNNKVIDEKLYKALNKIGVTEQQRKERNITFHSWRHYFNSMVRAEGLPDNMVRLVTGHKTLQMTEHYTHINPTEIKEIIKIQEKLCS